ncbi:MAG: hypothetical protein MJY50_05315 [Bacteroidales bacterium]|nr:hypothetical protein [Bacteroidales bacterium]
MERLLASIALALSLSACMEWDYPFGRPRLAVMPTEARIRPESASESGDSCGTAVYLCGVISPDGYNWQRDTAIGYGKGEVFLMKDFGIVCSFPAGYESRVSTDPDTHHLLGGRLYTEFSTLDCSVVKRDGQELFSYEGREFLVGLAVKDGAVYTLGRRRTGEGFTYRKNGIPVLDVRSGILFGSFADSSYPETGALYEDSHKLIFAYKTMTEGSRTVHIVEDGVDNVVAFSGFSGEVEDVKVIDGQVCFVCIQSDQGILYGSPRSFRTGGGSYRWESCRVVDAGETVFYAGEGVEKDGSRHNLILASNSGTVSSGPYEPSHIFIKDSRPVFIPYRFEGCFCFSRCCMAVSGSDEYAALSPEDGSPPVLRVNGEDRPLNVRGYLTGVEVCVNPPR